MTVVEARPAVAEPDTAALDELFRRIDEERVLPGGYRVQVIDGNIVMSLQRPVHSQLIFEFRDAIRDSLGRGSRVLSDVRVDLPGLLNGFCPDLMFVAEDSRQLPNGAIRYRDLLLVCEVVSASSRSDDYGRKLAVYASARIPLYVIVDARMGQVQLFTDPYPADTAGPAGYASLEVHLFGSRFELPGLDVTVETKEWPRD
jgi:Uma2 family endonuclease